MAYQCKFSICEIVSNEQITKEFGCGNAGGMRRSKNTNTLVLISDRTKGFYEDIWQDNILYFTGMGKSGAQDINSRQNKTLAESKINGVILHLFEVLIPTQYIYKGIVNLCKEPEQTKQNDENGNLRNVWIFPLSLTQPFQPIDEDTFKQNQEIKLKKIRKLSYDELEKYAKQVQNNKNEKRSITSSVYVRNAYVAEYAKYRAKGVCQLCEQNAPFLDKLNNPYLESHHIIWLSVGGEDTISNTVALCPNCHRKMHILNKQKDIDKLKSKIFTNKN